MLLQCPRFAAWMIPGSVRTASIQIVRWSSGLRSGCRGVLGFMPPCRFGRLWCAQNPVSGEAGAVQSLLAVSRGALTVKLDTFSGYLRSSDEVRIQTGAEPVSVLVQPKPDFREELECETLTSSEPTHRELPEEERRWERSRRSQRGTR